MSIALRQHTVLHFKYASQLSWRAKAQLTDELRKLRLFGLEELVLVEEQQPHNHVEDEELIILDDVHLPEQVQKLDRKFAALKNCLLSE